MCSEDDSKPSGIEDKSNVMLVIIVDVKKGVCFRVRVVYLVWKYSLWVLWASGDRQWTVQNVRLSSGAGGWKYIITIPQKIIFATVKTKLAKGERMNEKIWEN